jgi:small-conductance mechanosensitive channel
MGHQRFRALIRSIFCALSAITIIAAAPDSGPTQPSMQADAILAHLNRTVAWFHRLQAIEPQAGPSDDLVSRDRLRQTSTTALQLAFDFARASVPLVNASESASASSAAPAAPESASKPQGDAADSSDASLDRAVARSTQRVAALQARLADLEAQRAHPPASASARETLKAQRDEVEAALALAKDVQSTVQNLSQFATRGAGAGQAGAGLAGQIAQLERSVPEARHTTAKASASSLASSSAPAPATPGQASASPNATTAQAVAEPVFRPESAGLIALMTELLTLRAHRAELDDVLKETDALVKGLDDIRMPLINRAREIMRQTDSVTAATHDATEAARTREALQNASTQFKQISTVLIPAAEQSIATDASRATVAEWRGRFSAQIGTTVRYLIFRAMTLLIVIGVVLLLSDIWRRATFRYLHDNRRRRQFLLLRRIIVTAAISIVVILGIVSEAGSMATYVGFITAGVAVAMQNVILAIVAYFFLIGRYGVRVGDRITLAGVTGNVIEIGLVRIYLMELAGTDFHPTGRIVVLSNAVLFQPAALFKQVPGADYVWRVIALTFAADRDAQEVETRLREAADSVYEAYRPAIEQQHAVMQRYFNIETHVPRPELSVRLTSAGLECTVRYPAEPTNAAATDRKMIDALRAAVAKEPALTLVSSAGPIAE